MPAPEFAMKLVMHLCFIFAFGVPVMSDDDDDDEEIRNSSDFVDPFNVTEDSSSNSEEKKFLTPIKPIIANISHTAAMKNLKTLWVRQQNFFKNVTHAVREMCRKTKQSIEPLNWLFDEIDPLLVRQVKVLTSLPWEDTDEMYEVLDAHLLDQQERSWNALGRCMGDHYDFDAEHKEQETKLRNLFDKAKADLLKRRKAIENLEKHDKTT